MVGKGPDKFRGLRGRSQAGSQEGGSQASPKKFGTRTGSREKGSGTGPIGGTTCAMEVEGLKRPPPPHCRALSAGFN